MNSCRRASCSTDGADPRPTPKPSTPKPPGAILPFGGHKGSGLSFFCEILAGSLTGGHASNPRSPTADRLVNNMLSLVFDPAAFGDADAFADDVTQLVEWVKAAPPFAPGGKVLLPGEIEEDVRARADVEGLADRRRNLERHLGDRRFARRRHPDGMNSCAATAFARN